MSNTTVPCTGNCGVKNHEAGSHAHTLCQQRTAAMKGSHTSSGGSLGNAQGDFSVGEEKQEIWDREPVHMKGFSTKWIDNEDAVIEFGQYVGGAPSMQIYSVDGEPLSTATVALPDVNPEPGNVIIKDYSENEGMLKALQDQGVIGEPVKTHQAGFAVAYECQLLDGAEEDEPQIVTKKVDPISTVFETNPLLNEDDYGFEGYDFDEDYDILVDNEVEMMVDDVSWTVNSWIQSLDMDQEYVYIHGENLGWRGQSGSRVVSLDKLSENPIPIIAQDHGDVKQTWDLAEDGTLTVSQSHHDSMGEKYYFRPMTEEEFEDYNDGELDIASEFR